MTLRQDALLGPLDRWLASKFEPLHLNAAIEELLAATSLRPKALPEEDGIDAKIADCDRKLAQYRATLDAGGDPATVVGWITETETERARCNAVKRAAPPQAAPSMPTMRSRHWSATCRTCRPHSAPPSLPTKPRSTPS